MTISKLAFAVFILECIEFKQIVTEKIFQANALPILISVKNKLDLKYLKENLSNYSIHLQLIIRLWLDTDCI